jgi:hypothetical protein
MCSRHGDGEGSIQAESGGINIEVELRESLMKKLPHGRDGVRPVVRSVESHESTVRLLGIAVEIDGPFQNFDCRVVVISTIFVLGESEMRIESTAVEIVTDRLDPGVVAALEEVAPVSVDCMSECLAGIFLIVGSGRFGECVLKIPQVASDLFCIRLIPLSSLNEHLKRFLCDSA